MIRPLFSPGGTMLQRPGKASRPVETGAADKENEIGHGSKTPRTALKLVDGNGTRSGKVSPAASPSSKKMRLSIGKTGKAAASPSIKLGGLRDITNSALKPKTVTIITNTDSKSPHLLESKKRALPSGLGIHSSAPPSKLHIMNTASELDFSSMPDELLPEVEGVPAAPGHREEGSDDDFFEQYDFTYLTQLTATSFPGDYDAKRGLCEESEFECELSNLSIESLEDAKATLTPHGTYDSSEEDCN